MSNKLKKIIKNKHVHVMGIFFKGMTPQRRSYECIVSNDEVGKTLSIILDDNHMVTIPFEPLEKYFMS